MKRIGIDLGGTKIEGVLIDENDQMLQRIRKSTDQSRGYEFILTNITDLVNSLKTDKDESYRVGVCTPGAIEPATGAIKNSNTICLINKPFQADLEQKVGHRIKIENDANCFAKAEAFSGAGKGHGIVFGVIMGTGVGGGIVINQKIIQGNMHIAGEWGHHTLHPDGNLCYCGKNGCVETYISGPALERRWAELTGSNLQLRDIVNTVNRSDDIKELQWKEEFLDNFGLALSNVINILDPDIIVLGGGVSNIPFLYDDGIEHVSKYVFSGQLETLIVENKLGDSAGVIGAAYL
ncbi:ROK family protein [Candidatus Neomarinimicrobiota bacterium]